MPYQWSPATGATGRYRDVASGRFVSPAVVRRELDVFLSAADDVPTALSDALRGRSISLADWQLSMRAEIKRTHLNAIAMERGGWANMRPQDYGRAGQIIRGQYGYLERFANQIESGQQKLDGTLGYRSRLYTQAGRNSYYQSAQANLDEGVNKVRSIRRASDSCDDCIELDGAWFDVGDPEYLLPGARQCNANCQCDEEYGRELPDGSITAA